MLFSSLHHLTPNNVLHCYSRCHRSLRLYSLYFSSAIRGLPYTFPASLPSLAPTFLTGLFMALSLTVTCDTGFHKRQCVSSLHHVVNECHFSLPLPFLTLPFPLTHVRAHTMRTPAAPSILLPAVAPRADRCLEGFHSPDTTATEKLVAVFEACE